MAVVKHRKKQTVAAYILPGPRKADGVDHKRFSQLAAIFEGETWLLAVFECFLGS
jgi:hypothetical protein